jgi:tetratricopeptide (TPR) repeat protein
MTWANRAVLAALLVLLPLLGHADGATDRRAATDKLLDALKAAPSEAMAAPLEAQIVQMWFEAGTPAVTLLMSRGVRELKAGANDEAVDVFSDALILDPKLAEAYHQRAIARFHAGDTPGAVRDLEATLKLEPRAFPALRTLAEIAAAREDWKSAFTAWQKLLEINPKTPGGEDRLRELKRKAFGEAA